MAINENAIRGNITKQVQNEIAQQRQSINNGLATQKREFDNTINQNKNYLNEQIKGMNTQRIQTDDNITALQNRRGGFYSGGLDYQLAENLKNTQTQQGNLTRDINRQNNDILGKYNTLASQAANQISLLEQQGTDKIRELVNAELDRQRAIEFEREKFNWQKQIEQAQLALSRQKAAQSARTAQAKASKPKKLSKEESFAEGLAYWNGKLDDVRKQGAVRVERDLWNDSAQISELKNRGYDVGSVIDALYSAASDGRFQSKSDYTKYSNNLRKEIESSDKYY